MRTQAAIQKIERKTGNIAMIGKLQLGDFDGDRLVPRRLVRRVLSVNCRTMRNWEASGTIPRSICIGNREHFYLASVIEPWLIARFGEARVAALNGHLPGEQKTTKARAAISTETGP